MEMLVTKFSKGKYRNEGELFAETISAENVKLMGEMIALQALRTVKKFDLKIADSVLIEYRVGLRRVPVYIYKRRRSGPEKSLAALALFRGTPSARRRYRHTSQQPNRPKNTKITGLPKSIAELFGKRRRNGATVADCESKPPGKRSLRRRGRGGAGRSR